MEYFGAAMFVVLFVITLVGGVYLLVYGSVALLARMAAGPPVVKPPTPRGAFPVIPIDDGSGRYRIVGVSRQTQQDRDFTVEAQCRANALVKADLQGVVVTGIEKIG